MTYWISYNDTSTQFMVVLTIPPPLVKWSLSCYKLLSLSIICVFHRLVSRIDRFICFKLRFQDGHQAHDILAYGHIEKHFKYVLL